jgi:hypothetical protein
MIPVCHHFVLSPSIVKPCFIRFDCLGLATRR